MGGGSSPHGGLGGMVCNTLSLAWKAFRACFIGEVLCLVIPSNNGDVYIIRERCVDRARLGEISLAVLF
jgi:hypothetical protein